MNNKKLRFFRWNPDKNLLVVLISWVLVVVPLYTATHIVGTNVGGGLPYFFLYAVLGATIFGIGLPLYWMVVVCKRQISTLGLNTDKWKLSLVLQSVFFLSLYFSMDDLSLPSLEKLIPLLTLALAISFFEAVFWRGWIYLRLEEAFGIIPGLLAGAFLYAAYHIGYGMKIDEIIFLFFIGIMFAVVFRITKSILILWPLFQPLGQLRTLIEDGLELPLISSLGFIDVLIVMLVLVFLARKYYRKADNDRNILS